jgi:branched-chain amino acid transport system ATP-binding protein
MLTLEGVTAGYGGGDVITGVSLTLDPGEVGVILGPNGAGKTSTLRAISGLIRRAGAIVFDGIDLMRLGPDAIARLGIGHVPQGRGTFVELSVLENLGLGAVRRGDRRAVRADLDHMYALFPRLRERPHQAAGTLSGGEQQMLAIARALMARPRLLLLDEPSLGLAPLVTAEVFAALASLRDEGLTLVIVEQNAQLSLPLATRACVLESGRLLT